MAITYVPSASSELNIITVTGYSIGTPCNFSNLWTADKGGTLSLHARTGITGTDGATVAVDRAERPTDCIVLGGASNDLYITVANWNGTTATIRITGTDRDGTAQTEDIVVTGNGTSYTTKWFKTITHTQVTAFTATTFDYDLIQGQWGVVWKLGSHSYQIDCCLWIGSGGWFADENISANFTTNLPASVVNYPLKSVYGHLRFGRCTDQTNHKTLYGCDILISGSISWSACLSGHNLEMYSSIFRATSGWGVWQGSPWYFYNSNFLTSISGGGASNNKYYNIITTCMDSFAGEVEKVNMWNGGANSWKNSAADYYNAVNISTNMYFMIHQMSQTWKHVDCDYVWSNVAINYNWGGLTQSTGQVDRAYTFNIKVIGIDNSGIENVSVILKDKDDTEVFSTTTNASGVMTEQIVTSNYFKQRVEVPIVNAFDETNLNPFTLTLKKAGYKPYTKKFTLSGKVDWIIRRIHCNVCPDQEVMLA